jgi:hypothetical protein
MTLANLTHAANKPTAARSIRRTQKAVEASRTAADCIGKIEKDLALFAVTRGQFSMIDAIQHCLAEMGPSRLTLWTWCIADYEVETFESLLRAGNVTSALLVIDRAGNEQVSKTRAFRAGTASKSDANSRLMGRWIEKFGPGSIKVVLNHAKIATLDNGTLKVVVRGSMNLNHNPRFEQIDITEGADVYNLVREIEDSLPILPPNYSTHDLQQATGAHALFSPEDLKPFLKENLKVWAK